MYPLSKSTENFRKALEIANRTAAELGTTFVGSEHFIYAFLSLPDCEAYKILRSGRDKNNKARGQTRNDCL